MRKGLNKSQKGAEKGRSLKNLGNRKKEENCQRKNESVCRDYLSIG